MKVAEILKDTEYLLANREGNTSRVLVKRVEKFMVYPAEGGAWGGRTTRMVVCVPLSKHSGKPSATIYDQTHRLSAKGRSRLGENEVVVLPHPILCTWEEHLESEGRSKARRQRQQERRNHLFSLAKRISDQMSDTRMAPMPTHGCYALMEIGPEDLKSILAGLHLLRQAEEVEENFPTLKTLRENDALEQWGETLAALAGQ